MASSVDESITDIATNLPGGVAGDADVTGGSGVQRGAGVGLGEGSPAHPVAQAAGGAQQCAVPLPDRSGRDGLALAVHDSSEVGLLAPTTEAGHCSSARGR